MSQKKNEITDGFDTENSTVFSKPVRLTAEELKEKKRKRKKTALTVVIVFVIVFAVIPWLILKIVGTADKDYVNTGEPKFTYTELIDRVDLVNEPAKKLFKMKNPDLKDTAKVQEIIQMLVADGELGEFDLEIQSTEKPYNITFKFKHTHTVADEGEVDEWENEMRPLACATMALIDSVAQVNWEFPLENGQTEIRFFTRANADEYMNLNVAIERFAESETSVQLLLNQLGIDLYE